MPTPTLTDYDRKPLDITFTPDTTPSAVHTLISAPHYWKKRFKQDLDRDITMGIIEPVLVGIPTNCYSRMLVTTKKTAHTVDLQ